MISYNLSIKRFVSGNNRFISSSVYLDISNTCDFIVSFSYLVSFSICVFIHDCDYVAFYNNGDNPIPLNESSAVKSFSNAVLSKLYLLMNVYQLLFYHSFI